MSIKQKALKKKLFAVSLLAVMVFCLLLPQVSFGQPDPNNPDFQENLREQQAARRTALTECMGRNISDPGAIALATVYYETNGVPNVNTWFVSPSGETICGIVGDTTGKDPWSPELDRGIDRFNRTAEDGRIRSFPLADGNYTVKVDQKIDDDFKEYLNRLTGDGFWDRVALANPLLGPRIAITEGFKQAWNSLVTDNVEGEAHLVGQATFKVKDGKVYDSTGNQITNYPGIKVEVKVEMKNGAIEKAVRTMAGMVLDFVVSAINWSIGLINKLLAWTQETTLRDSVRDAWVAMRNISISFLMFILIIIAFTNALQVRVEQYGVGRMIPKIIIAIIMSYFSWLIVMFFFDFTNALQQGASSLVNNMPQNQWVTVMKNSTGISASNFASSIALLFLAIAMLVGILICLCILMFSLLIRVIVLSFLLAVAPLAFICNILPFTESMYKRWWSTFFKWIFMGPAVVFILALGVILAGGGNPNYAGSPLSETTITDTETGVGALLSVIMMAAAIYLAATMPLKWGGGIMTGWQGLGKKLAGMGKKAGALGYNTAMDSNKATRGLTTTGIKSFFKGRKADIEGRRAAAGTVMRAGAADKLGGTGRFMAGTKGYQQTALHSAAVDERSKVLDTNNMSLEGLNGLVENGSGLDQEAAVLELVNRGLLHADHQKVFSKLATKNSAIRNSAFKNQLDLAINSDDADLRQGGLRAAKNKATHDLSARSLKGINDALSGNLTPQDQELAAKAVNNWTTGGANNQKLNAMQIREMKNITDTVRSRNVQADIGPDDEHPQRVPAISPDVAAAIDRRYARMQAPPPQAPPSNDTFQDGGGI